MDVDFRTNRTLSYGGHEVSGSWRPPGLDECGENGPTCPPVGRHGPAAPRPDGSLRVRKVDSVGHSLRAAAGQPLLRQCLATAQGQTTVQCPAPSPLTHIWRTRSLDRCRIVHQGRCSRCATPTRRPPSVAGGARANAGRGMVLSAARSSSGPGGRRPRYRHAMPGATTGA